MAAAPRGKTGTVRGLSRAFVLTTLQAYLAHLRRQGAQEVTEAGVVGWLRECHPGVTGGQARSLAAVFARMHGARKLARGHWVLPEDAEAQLEHRTWRFPAGRLDYPSAVVLLAVLDEYNYPVGAPPALIAYHSRLARTVQALQP